MKHKLILLTMLFFSLATYAEQSFIQVEGALLYQTRNDQRIPGNTGTEFSLDEFDRSPFEAYRIYVGNTWNKKHELRLLYAPLEVEIKGRFTKNINFNGTTFTPGEVKGLYKFNSYRLTYAYILNPVGEWVIKIGGTAKVRDAEVAVTQGNVTSSKKNVGFVPLLNFQATRSLSEKTKFRFDFDGLAAPQGRAFDVALFLEREIVPGFSILGGYRTLEGGADTESVYNMGWFHFATVGLRAEF